MVSAPRRSAGFDSYFRQINETDLLSEGDEIALATLVQNGDIEARDEMVRANLRLVVSMARRHLKHGICMADLIQEGNLGLVHAVERFDPTRNTKFSSYAKFWIRDAMSRAVKKLSTPIRLSSYANELMRKWRKTAMELRDQLGRVATEEEIGEKLQLTRRQVTIIRKAIRIQGSASQRVDADQTDEANAHAHLDVAAPVSDAVSAEETQHVLSLVSQLPARDAAVLRLRFGLDGEDPQTLAQVGERLALTRERVRQIERDALARLRGLIDPE